MHNRQKIAIGAVTIGGVLICAICLTSVTVFTLIEEDLFTLPFLKESDNGAQSIEGSLPKLLNVGSFPAQEIEYPMEWPAFLRFPNELTVVETNSGTLVDGVSVGWITSFVFWEILIKLRIS